MFTQPLAQITSSKLWPVGCITLSLRVNDLAGCRPAERGETERMKKTTTTAVESDPIKKKGNKNVKKEMAQEFGM